MATGQLGGILQRLRTAALLQEGSGMTDGQLLECFLTGRDEAAFAALVRRHGPMVLGVCRRVLRHVHDAEDAFQATFLILARKAHSIAHRERLASWLYGAAFRAALEARAARRRIKERQVSAMPEPFTADDPNLWSDLRPALDRELDRLPEKYRVPIVLCDLEGHTRRAAAQQLGLATGTLSGRLTTARRMLAKRLMRYGLAISGGELATVLAQASAATSVPRTLTLCTAQVACQLVDGAAETTAFVSASVARLMNGVLKTMLLTKLKLLTKVFLLTTLACWLAGALTHASGQPVQAPEQRKEQKADPQKPANAAQSHDPVDAKQILKTAADACRKIKYIEYVEEQFLDKENKTPFCTVKVRQARADVPDAGYLPGKFVVEGEITRDGPKPEPFAISYDGKTLRRLDSADKSLYVATSPSSGDVGHLLGAHRIHHFTGLGQITHDRPFQFILNDAVSLEHKGTRIIHGVLCDAIEVTRMLEHPVLGKKQSISLWFIGRDDHLPRGNESGRTLSTARFVKVSAIEVPAEYTLATPRGYTPKAATGREAATNGLLAVGETAPEWSLRDPQGHVHSLKDYRGKIVVLDFWGSWCVPCRKSMPAIQALHEKFAKRGVAVFGAAVVDKEGKPEEYMKRQNYTYTLLLNGDDLAKAYKAVSLPTVYIIGVDGKVLYAEHGFREQAKEDLERILEKHLASAKK